MAFEHDTITPYKNDAGSKKEQVAKMFDQIAFRYDFLNRFLSAGIDIGWRKKAIRQLKDLHPKTLLDVATGTADVALLSHKLLAPEKIIGIDISEGMLELGRKKIAARQLEQVITLQNGDSEAINFPDASFDALTVAFGVRNFAHLERGLSEMLRVMRPGGKAVILEFSKPKMPGIRNLYNLYTRIVAPQAGRMIAKNKDAYQYLNDSIEAFPEGNAFLKIMDSVGFKSVHLKTLSFGICTIYCGSKSSCY
ncbi:MAG: bifunctional demethylmenaquinone methyltransferase/2-methoxy-6-polyprenyl-1,4-benzoquinol methylase UbiE [Chitinophagaceae bacterium]